MAWLTRKRPDAVHAPDPNGDDALTTDWSSDDPTGSIMVVHERIATSSPPTGPILAGPVLDGAVSATVIEKVDGLMQQVQYDLSIGHHLEADELLRERLKASQIELEEEQIAALVDELAPVDYARHERERREADEAADAAGEETSS
ncbi:hypothetical protein EV140_1763 [Microcella alkaliphila]|uniref:Uncharacterized protein n=1 Tax=Microcella alkaliphila TaxID=279828 RepID=A0A4Q7TF88_9MICO|nr:hypothetical protein [Microcella alkaliphila]RZT59161.1 hypothetical protein EV140_1763 [Microcella alkaliphila]